MIVDESFIAASAIICIQTMTVVEMYNEFWRRLQANQIGNDLNTADVSLALLDSSHTKDTANNSVFDDVSANEITNTNANDSGYSQGGKVVQNFSIASDPGNRNVDADGDDVVWSSSTITAGYAVLYHSQPASESDQDLIMLVDFEGNASSSSGDFEIGWATEGIYRANNS